ncbi:MAG: aminotransferase class V-fold PLP-dependent enzyme [Candidatus Eisenbacteria bacterium]
MPIPHDGSNRDVGTGATDPLLRYRGRFPILDSCCYLVSHSLGAMPREARDGLLRYADEWDARGVRAWREGWWDLPLAFGDQLAPLLGAEDGTICMQPNATLASAILLSALDFAGNERQVPATGARNRIVTTDLDFPSMLYLYDSIELPGSEVVRVPTHDGLTIDPEELIANIDERTRLVALSHVVFRTSFLHDVGRITRHAHAVGASVLLDLYHSAGVVPFSLTELQVDFAVGGNLKFLLGGPGVAFLYVRRDLQDSLVPRTTGWMAHADPFGFHLPPIEHATGMARFLHGTPAIPALRAAEPGLAIVKEVGVHAIREKSLRLTRIILDHARAAGWAVRTPEEDARRGGVVGLEPAHAYEVSQCLLDRGVVIDYRPGGGIRMAPHFYNTETETRRALDEIGDILESGAWRTYESTERERVT